MLLTLLWGSCVVVGKCDLVDANARDEVDTKGFSLTGTFIYIHQINSISFLFLFFFSGPIKHHFTKVCSEREVLLDIYILFFPLDHNSKPWGVCKHIGDLLLTKSNVVLSHV